jgi:hypothetical protein
MITMEISKPGDGMKQTNRATQYVDVRLPPKVWKVRLYKLFGLQAPDRWVRRPAQFK